MRIHKQNAHSHPRETRVRDQASSGCAARTQEVPVLFSSPSELLKEEMMGAVREKGKKKERGRRGKKRRERRRERGRKGDSKDVSFI